MKNIFFDKTECSEVKIFSIDKDFYELRGLGSNEKIINFIVDKHRELVNRNDEIGQNIPKIHHNDITYYSYVYNEYLKDSYWIRYLPTSITKNHDFGIQQISFTLFAVVKDKIFCIIGGGGIRVIKRYLNNRFGLEFYEFLVDNVQDIILSITLRSISGRLTEQREIYRNDQTLIDSIGFMEIPTKISLKLREDLRNSFFDFIIFNSDEVTIEVGSYFLIKQRIQFEQLHELFLRIENTFRNHNRQSLSSFDREKDMIKIENEYRKILCENLRGDMMNRFESRDRTKNKKLDIDFIHPSKIQDYYECNRYELKAKGKKKPFFESNVKSELYLQGLKYIYDNLSDYNNQFEFDTIIFGIRVLGYRDKVLMTEAMFLQHITSEISYNGIPIFCIDNNWYKIKNDFIDTINDRCIKLIEKKILGDNILDKVWDANIKDEDAYNKSYLNRANYYVFDKMLGQNIEFCDIMYENESSIYLIHIKDGFDAKIRDLSNQILISSNRFWNDINSGSTQFIESVVESYNKNNSNQLDKVKFIQKFKSNKEIIYVMAFNSNKQNMPMNDRILQSRSNIAKFSLVQCSLDMSSMYTLKIKDIVDIK